MANQVENLTPRQIVQELDNYIVGQKAAKRSVAVAMRNRWRRLNADESIRDEIIPNNIILIGPTGVGKTEIARRISKLAKAPFIKVEASKFTEVGYVGRDVESIIRDLTDIGVSMVKSEMQSRIQKKAEEMVDERILDILIPPVKSAKASPLGFNEDKQSDDEFNPETASEEELNQRTRDKFREKLKNGDLDERKIELDVSTKSSSVQIFGPIGVEEMGINLQDMLGNLNPPKKKKKQIKISEAKRILLTEEMEKLVDHDAAVQEALERVQNSGIVFIDEIDKIASPSTGDGRGGPDVSRQGVQRDLLPIVEGSNVTTKYGVVKTEHILFIASGAFHIAKPSDLIPELQGRFPIRVEMDSLTEEDFYQILTTPQTALTKQYQAMFESENIKLEFTDDAIRQIARIAAEVNSSVENIGARRLHTILSSVLEELLFAIPDDIHEGVLTIDEAYVDKQLADIVKDRDLSQFIL